MLRTAILFPRNLPGVFTYRFSIEVTPNTGYILHGFLVLPWQDFHLQASVSLAGHTTQSPQESAVDIDSLPADVRAEIGREMEV